MKLPTEERLMSIFSFIMFTFISVCLLSLALLILIGTILLIVVFSKSALALAFIFALMSGVI